MQDAVTHKRVSNIKLSQAPSSKIPKVCHICIKISLHQYFCLWNFSIFCNIIYSLLKAISYMGMIMWKNWEVWNLLKGLRRPTTAYTTVQGYWNNNCKNDWTVRHIMGIISIGRDLKVILCQHEQSGAFKHLHSNVHHSRSHVISAPWGTMFCKIIHNTSPSHPPLIGILAKVKHL